MGAQERKKRLQNILAGLVNSFDRFYADGHQSLGGYFCSIFFLAIYPQREGVEKGKFVQTYSRVVKKTNFGKVCGLMAHVVRNYFLSSMMSLVAKNINP